MKRTNCVSLLLWGSLAVRCLAGDLTVDGNLNVMSNLTASGFSAGTAVVDALAVTGDAVVAGNIQGSGAGVTNVPGTAIVPGTVGTNRAVLAEWNRWGDARYMSVTGISDLVMGPGRTAAGNGLALSNILTSAYGAEQRGFNNGSTQTIAGAAYGAEQRGYNAVAGSQRILLGAHGAEQRGYNSGAMTIGSNARGAEQRGYNLGFMMIGPIAYGAGQRGVVGMGASATNGGKGSVQLLNLTSNQLAVMRGSAALGLGACEVTNDQAIVAGDGLASHGNGTVTAAGFFGDGSGLTNLSAATLPTNSITADKLSAASVSTVAIVTGAVTAEKLAADAVTSLKIQDGTILDADVAPDAAISQSKIAGLTNAVSALDVHLVAFDNPHHVTAAQIGALTNEIDTVALLAISSLTNQTRILIDDSGVTNYARVVEGKLMIWSYTTHNATWVVDGTNITAPLPYPLDYYDDSAWTVTPWGDVAWIGRKNSSDAGYYDTANGIDRSATIITFSTLVLRYIDAGVFTNITACAAPVAPIPPYISTVAALDQWLADQQSILTNAVISNIRAADIGGITNETDAAAIAALAQYAATNKTHVLQDVDQAIWWEANGGTNLIARKTLNPPEVSFSADFRAGDGTIPMSSSYSFPFYDENDWCCYLDLGGIYLRSPGSQDVWYWFGNLTSVSDLPEEVTLLPLYGNGQGEAYVKTVEVVGSYNLTTGDVWKAILSAYPSSNPSNYVDAASAAAITSVTISQMPVINNNGSSLTNLNLAAYVGEHLVWDSVSNKLNVVGGFVSNVTSFLSAEEITNAVVAAWPALDTNASNDLTTAGGTLSGDLNMNSNRVTNLPMPVAGGDAASKDYLQSYMRSVLSSLPPQGNLSMGAFTNGAPASFPLSF